MKRRRKWKEYSAPRYIIDALQQLKPPEDLLISEWAEKYRRLSSKTSAIPGPWRNSMTPYLVGVMDEFCNFETQEIVFCKPTQVGGTEALLNIIGYYIHNDPSPMIIVYPTQELAESISENRIKPMIQSAQPLNDLWRESSSKKLELQFEGMYLSLVGSNSPSSLASKACKIVGIDEVDKFPEHTGKEADPVSLVKERSKTFMGSSKFYVTSTPTLSTNYIWKALKGADCEKHYFVPCPHCGEFIELTWSNLKFTGKDDPKEMEGLTPSECAESAVYVCPECAGVIQEFHKDKMLRGGEWRIVEDRNSTHKSVGFWLSTLYSPFTRFSEIALEYLQSRDSPDSMQNFVNSWLAEPWEDTKLKTSADMVMERQTELPELVVPEWAKILTGGVDVQENCLYWTIRAWGNHFTSQNICHGQAETWADVERVMNLEYTSETGEAFVVALCLIDAGYNPDATYDFYADNFDWAMPVKGASSGTQVSMVAHYKMFVINRAGSKADGMNYVQVDGGKYKDMIAARMRKENGIGSWMVYKGCDLEYANMVTSEHKVNVKTGKNGRDSVLRWIPKHSNAQNHYLDAEVYAMAAADMRGVRYMHLNEVQAPMPEKPKPQQYAPEESWIGQNDNWL